MGKIISNKNRQKLCDLEKWFESKKQGHDMSGCMPYCEHCEKADHSHPTELGKCYATQEERVANSFCAKAYNLMKKDKNE